MTNIINKKKIHEFYAHNIMLLGLCVGILLIPFALHKIVVNMYNSFFIILALILIALINSFHINRYKTILIPIWIWYLMIMISITHLMHLGVYVMFWCYPALFTLFFVQSRAEARVMSLISLISYGSMSFYNFAPEVAIRFCVTSTLLVVFCDLLVGVLNEYQYRLSELAIRDPLTNAYNRRFMDEILGTLYHETKRQSSRHCMIFFDIDYFKDINDNFGHHQGDIVLVELVGVIEQRKRKIDHLFRMGGEEFALILKNTSLDNAHIIAENFRKDIEANSFSHEEVVTISAGVAELQEEEKVEDWLKRIDRALYQAKQQGRNQTCLA